MPEGQKDPTVVERHTISVVRLNTISGNNILLVGCSCNECCSVLFYARLPFVGKQLS